jgi:hypothetical protein
VLGEEMKDVHAAGDSKITARGAINMNVVLRDCAALSATVARPLRTRFGAEIRLIINELWERALT